MRHLVGETAAIRQDKSDLDHIDIFVKKLSYKLDILLRKQDIRFKIRMGDRDLLEQLVTLGMFWTTFSPPKRGRAV